MEMYALYAVGVSLMYRALIRGVKRCFTTVLESLFPMSTCTNTYIQISYVMFSLHIGNVSYLRRLAKTF